MLKTNRTYVFQITYKTDKDGLRTVNSLVTTYTTLVVRSSFTPVSLYVTSAAGIRFADWRVVSGESLNHLNCSSNSSTATTIITTTIIINKNRRTKIKSALLPSGFFQASATSRRQERQVRNAIFSSVIYVLTIWRRGPQFPQRQRNKEWKKEKDNEEGNYRSSI